MNNKEIRYFAGSFEVREDEKGKRVTGHAAVYNQLSENLGNFREKIAEGAFDEALGDDVRALFNHDPNHILARTKSGTLTLASDGEGLRYDFSLPQTTMGKDLGIMLERGDISQSSFGFTVKEDKWAKDEDGKYIRTILKVGRLYDVSPVTFPAYPDAKVALRSLQEFEEAEKTEEQPQKVVEQTVDEVDQKYRENVVIIKLKC